MPVFSKSTPPIQQIQSRPATLRESVAPYVRNVVQGAIAPYVDIYNNAKSLVQGDNAQLVDFSKQVGDPWIGYKSPATPSILKVFGKELPDGIIMTHCTVTDSVDYSPRPVSQLDNASLNLTATMITGTDSRGVKGRGYNLETRLAQLSRSGSTSQGAAMLAEARAFIASHGKLKEREMNDELAKIVKRYEDKIDAEVVEKSLIKAYIGDALPRVAELRFVIADAIQSGTDYASDKLLFDRYDLLAHFHHLLCHNPDGATLAPVVASTNGRTAAQRITAMNVVGRVLQLDSVGLAPYKVKSWVVTRFRHIEVPDSDLIAVQLVATEFEQIANSNLAKPPTASLNTCFDPASAKPAVEVRPVYTSNGVA